MEKITPDNNKNSEIKNPYPGVSDRIKAAFVDSIITVLFLFLATFVLSKFDVVSDSVRIITFLFIFGFYDPIFTSIFGGTIGHFAMGIRVKRKSNPEKNIMFPYAVIRFIVKLSLGIISLFTVSNSQNRLAIHDFATGSLVVFKKIQN
jgi:uncharacterized RDD family membrane protein YckC